MVIKVVTMVEVVIFIKIPDTITLKIVDQELILTGEVNIGLIPTTITCTTQVVVVDCWVSQFILVLLTNMFIVII